MPCPGINALVKSQIWNQNEGYTKLIHHSYTAKIMGFVPIVRDLKIYKFLSVEQLCDVTGYAIIFVSNCHIKKARAQTLAGGVTDKGYRVTVTN